MLQTIITVLLGVAGIGIFLSAPITIFLGQKRGNWELGSKRMLRYLGLSQLGITVLLVAGVVLDFQMWPSAMAGFLVLGIVHILSFAIYWLQIQWLARIAKNLRDEPRWR